MDDPFAVLALERRALADTLETLTPEQWAAPSLCGDWTVKDTAAHLVVGPTASMTEFVLAMATSRFDFDRANRKLTARRADRPTDEVVALIRRHADSRFTPPGQDWHAPLMDLFIHRLDCLVPLGIPTDRPLAPWTEVLDYLVRPGTQRIFAKRAVAGVTLVATDVGWSHGSGPQVSGTAESVGLALAGRRAALERLGGPGVGTLDTWLAR